MLIYFIILQLRGALLVRQRIIDFHDGKVKNRSIGHILWKEHCGDMFVLKEPKTESLLHF